MSLYWHTFLNPTLEICSPCPVHVCVWRGGVNCSRNWTKKSGWNVSCKNIPSTWLQVGLRGWYIFCISSRAIKRSPVVVRERAVMWAITEFNQWRWVDGSVSFTLSRRRGCDGASCRCCRGLRQWRIIARAKWAHAEGPATNRGP